MTYPRECDVEIMNSPPTETEANKGWRKLFSKTDNFKIMAKFSPLVFVTIPTFVNCFLKNSSVDALAHALCRLLRMWGKKTIDFGNHF